MSNENPSTKKKVGGAPGRYKLYHYGHEEGHLTLLNELDEIVILIGSCYVHGTERNSTLAVFIIKSIIGALEEAGVSQDRYKIKCIKDCSTDEEWFRLILRARDKFGITHFVTGNEEDILSKVDSLGYDLNMELINPERLTKTKYHGTEIRELVRKADFEGIKARVPRSTRQILFSTSTFDEIIAASEDRGINFVPGYQTVDMVILLKNKSDGKLYVLLGKRNSKKEDFASYFALPGGGIDDDEFETPFDAVLRTVKEETGYAIDILDNSMEPAVVKFSNIEDSGIKTMRFVGLYSSTDEHVAGTKKGSSQCFSIFIEDDIEKYRKYLKEGEDLTDLDFYDLDIALNMVLAYQHSEMIRRALYMFKATPLVKKEYVEEKINTRIISIIGGSQSERNILASGIDYVYKQLGVSCKIAENAVGDKLDVETLLGSISNNTYVLDMQNHIIQKLLGKEQVVVTSSQFPDSLTYDINILNDKRTWYLFDHYENFIIYLDNENCGDSMSTIRQTLMDKKYDVHFVKNQEEGLNVAIDYAKTTLGSKANVIVPKVTI
ncbi:MAG: NUDIX domain-containing protein [Clostridia bacterium]|nr:NUDIX domain-containing protein [Clostridia bacterium]